MKRTILLALLAVAAGACSSSAEVSTTTTSAGIAEDAAYYQNVWYSAGVDSYRLTYRNDCGECLPADQGPFTIEVVRGSLRSVTDAAGDPVPAELWTGPASVEALFTMIRDAQANGSVVDAVFDAGLGIPLEIEIDMHEREVDGGTRIVVTGFDDDPGIVTGGLLDETLAARERWDAAQSGTYSFTYTRDCFCPEEYRGPFEFDIVDGVRTEIRFKGEPYFDRALEEFETIEDIFDEVVHALESGADAVNVEFDAELGYPRSVWIDRDFNIADEEMGYTITDVRR